MTSVASKGSDWLAVWRCGTLVALFAWCVTGLGVLGSRARAEEHEPDWDLRVFAQEPRAQRNRVAVENVPADAAARLVTIIDTGVRGCDCLPRRLRWAWALPRPTDGVHPALVVSFEDRPREHAQILMYERLALVSYKEGKYVVAGVLTLNRPLATADASLNVRMLPRRDFDEDGQLDIAISYVERWKQSSECGRILFQSGNAQPVFERVTCAKAP